MSKTVFKLAIFLFQLFLFQFSLALDLEEIENQSSSESEISNIVKNKIKDIEWLANREIVISAVLQQNKQQLTSQEIHKRDLQWQASSENEPFKKSLQEGECGLFLQSVVSNSKVFSEIFITDNQGANVKAYPATTDYWQGDEDKWFIPFNQNRIYLGEVEFDESSQERSVQVSIPIKNEEEIIGVLVAGIKMSFIEYKLLKQSIK